MVASPGWPSLAVTSSARVRRRTPAVVSLGLVAVFFAPAKLAFSVGVSFAGAGCHHVRQRVCLNAGKASLEVSGSVEPLGSFVLVKVGAAEAETKSGILLAKSEKPKGGEAIAVGPGEADSDSGVVTPLTVAVGDQVVYSRYSGSEIMSVGGVEHVLVREDDILLRYTGDEPSVSSLSMPRGKILVKLQSSEEATDSGILLSKGAVKQSSTVGEVVAVGAGDVLPDGSELPAPVKVGDTVRFRYGDEVDLDIDDDRYSVVKVSNCIAKWKTA